MTAPEITIAGLFDAIGIAGHEIAAAMRDNDDDAGERACSGLLNALAMLPEELRFGIATALTDRSYLAPELRGLAL